MSYPSEKLSSNKDFGALACCGCSYVVGIMLLARVRGIQTGELVDPILPHAQDRCMSQCFGSNIALWPIK